MSFAFDSLVNFPFSITCDILNHWLPIKHIAKLDSACCSSSKRQFLLKFLSSREFIQHDQVSVSNTPQFNWYVRRSIGVSNILVDTELSVDDKVSHYFWMWGKNMRELHFAPDASGDLYLIPVHCRNLKSIACRVEDADYIIHDILRYNPSLEEISFHNVNIQPIMLKDVLFPMLRVLCFTEMNGLVRAFAQVIGQLCDGLTHLSLAQMELESPELILDITLRYKNLRSLDLTDTNVTGSCVTAVALLCPLIVNLSLRQCSLIDDACILSISQQLRQLRTLDIRDCAELIHNMNGYYLCAMT